MSNISYNAHLCSLCGKAHWPEKCDQETIESLKKDKLDLIQHGVEQGIQISNLEHAKKKFIEWLEATKLTHSKFKDNSSEDSYGNYDDVFTDGTYLGEYWAYSNALNKAKEML